MARATLIGFSAVAMWALLALFTAASGNVPPFMLSAMAFTVGTAVGLGARVFSPREHNQARLTPAGWGIGIAWQFG
jgi:hypothetical protein